MPPVRRPEKKCPHGRRRYRCRDCGAPARSGKKCPHGRQRNHCADCGGAGVCSRGRVRARCRDCGGASYCEHSRLRSYCRDCGGASYCSHGRRRNHCSDCGGGSVCKSKELEVHQALRDAQITFEYQHYLPFRGCGLESETAHAFADFALPAPWGYVLLEVDEEQHKVYDPSCSSCEGFEV